MSTPPPNSKFQPQMPNIPGLGRPRSGSPRGNLPSPLGLAAAVVLGILVMLAFHWATHRKPAEPTRSEALAPHELSVPAPKPAPYIPRATSENPVVASISDLATPWSSAEFTVHSELTGEDVPAMIIRLPGGSAAQSSGYWAFSKKAPFGKCRLEFITDLDKLRSDYNYRHATHPMVGDPCTRTLFDPLKTTTLPGNLWIRGAIVQGSDVRPPLGVEIKLQGKNILALRSE